METSSEMENPAKNILELPYEMLLHIVKFVPNRANLSLVCSKFYEISCQSKYFKITAKMLLDRDFENLVENSEENSRRRFNSVHLCDDFGLTNDEIMLRQKHIKLLELVGKDIKILSIYGLFELEIDSSLRSLLELLPNLEKICLGDEVLFLKPEPDHGTLLNLPKLREFSINGYVDTLVETLNYLPNDLLRKIQVRCDGHEKLRQADFRKLFSSQRQLKEISICSCVFPWVDSNALVRSVTYENNLEPFFKRLKSIETLDLELEIIMSSGHARSLSKLQNLKTLSITSDAFSTRLDWLNGLSSPSLRKLGIINSFQSVITAPTLITLSRNLPQLEYLRLQTKLPNEIINKVIEHFSKLKMFYFKASNGRYVFQDNLVNENLTTLIIEANDNFMSEDIPKLLAACTSLNWFETTMRIDAENIQAILTHQPKLTTLLLLEAYPALSVQFVEVLKMYGKNLLEFMCKFESFEEEEWKMEELVRNEFKETFKNIKFYGNHNDYTLEMNDGFPKGITKNLIT